MHPMLRILVALIALSLCSGASALRIREDAPVNPKLEKAVKDATVLKLGESITIPDFKTIDGKTVTAKDLQGKVVVIEYWASWCPFCAKQLPYFEKLYRARADDGLVIIGLNIEKEEAKARGFVSSRKLTFPVVMTTPAIDKALKRPKGLPVTYVIGRDGLLKRIETGEMFEEDVAEIGEMLGPVRK